MNQLYWVLMLGWGMATYSFTCLLYLWQLPMGSSSSKLLARFVVLPEDADAVLGVHGL